MIRLGILVYELMDKDKVLNGVRIYELLHRHRLMQPGYGDESLSLGA